MRDLSADSPPDLEAASAEEVLRFAVERFHPRLSVACSFQKEASVIMDLLVRIQPEARFFTLDTGVLFEETYETWRRVEEHYGITVDRHAGISLERQAAEYGDALWNRDPDRCCGLRKVTPLNEALAELDAWVSGVRREQSTARGSTAKLHWDRKHDLWKVNPLADWSDRDVWSYIAANDVPYHPLHDRGYASIGCTHCTVAGGERDGRWAGSDKIECGIHGS